MLYTKWIPMAFFMKSSKSHEKTGFVGFFRYLLKLLIMWMNQKNCNTEQKIERFWAVLVCFYVCAISNFILIVSTYDLILNLLIHFFPRKPHFGSATGGPLPIQWISSNNCNSCLSKNKIRKTKLINQLCSFEMNWFFFKVKMIALKNEMLLFYF